MTRFARSTLSVALAMLLALAFGAPDVVAAAEPAANVPAAPRAPEPADAPTREEIRAWIGQLSADGYSARDKAQRNLTAAGVAAIDELAEATKGDNAEVRARSFAVLTKLLQSPDNELMLPAKAALEKLAAGSDKSISRNASDALLQIDPLAWDLPSGDNTVRFAGGGGVFIVNGATSISRTESGGRRTFRMQTGDQTIDITQTDAKGIEMYVTRSINGRELKGRYMAKTADELKAKHPKAFTLFEQYMQKPNGNVNAAIFARKAMIRPAIVLPAKPAKAAEPAPKAPEPASAPEPNHVDVPRVPAPPQIEKR